MRLQRGLFKLLAAEKDAAAIDAACPRAATIEIARFSGFRVTGSEMLVLSDVAHGLSLRPPPPIAPFPPAHFAGTGFTREEITAVVEFVNPEARWPPAALMTAYRHIVVLSAAADALSAAPAFGQGFLFPLPTAEETSATIERAADADALSAALRARPDIAWRALWDSVASPKARAGAPTKRSPLAVDTVALIEIAISTGATSLLARMSIRAAATAGLVARALSVPSPELLFPAASAPIELSVPLHDAATSLVGHRETFARLCRPLAPNDAATFVAVLFAIDVSFSGPFAVADAAKMTVDAAAAGGIEAAAAAQQVDTWFAPVDGSPLAAPFAIAPHFFDMRVTWKPVWARLYAAHQEIYFARKAGFQLPHFGRVEGDEGVATGVSADAAPTTVSYPSLVAALTADAEALAGVTLGVHPLATNVLSPLSRESIVETVSQHGACSVVTFSAQNADGALFRTTLSVADVAATIEATETFAVPLVENEPLYYLSRRTVSILARLAEDVTGSRATSHYFLRLSAEAAEAYEGLLRAIRVATLRAAKVSSHGLELAAAAAAPEVRGAVIAALRELFALSMFMRGWKKDGCDGPYPLRAADTTYDPGLQDAVEGNVGVAIIAYDAAVDAIPDTTARRLTRAAPLLRIKRPKAAARRAAGEIDFVPVQNVEQGLTVEDRVAIVREGEGGSIFSCLRMSSNVLAASAYYYLVYALRMTPPASLVELDEIS